MIIFHTALFVEAKPLIEHFKLTKDITNSSHQIFSKDDIFLIISGVGKVKAATAIGSILTKQKANIENLILINFGIAGSNSENEIEKLFLINKITDFASQKSFYSDQIVKSTISEKEIITFDKPVSKTNLQISIDKQIVDMESSAVWESARVFLSSSQIAIFKVISDSLESKKVNGDYVTKLIKKNISTIINYAKNLEKLLLDTYPKCLTNEDIIEIEKLIKELKLSHSEKLKLIELSKAFKVKNKDLSLKSLLNQIPINSKSLFSILQIQ